MKGVLADGFRDCLILLQVGLADCALRSPFWRARSEKIRHKRVLREHLPAPLNHRARSSTQLGRVRGRLILKERHLPPNETELLGAYLGEGREHGRRAVLPV